MAVVMGLSMCLSGILDCVWIQVDILYVSYFWWLVTWWLYSANFWLCSWPRFLFSESHPGHLICFLVCFWEMFFITRLSISGHHRNSVMWLAVPTALHRWSCVNGCPPLHLFCWRMRVPVCNQIELPFLIPYGCFLIVKTASRWR